MVQPANHPSTGNVASSVSRLQQRWAGGGFALAVQLPPLFTLQVRDYIEQAALHADCFDAVITTDAPGGAVALSSMAYAILLKRAGIEPVVQLNGRDRNRLALQGELLGLGALKLPNLLIDTRPVTRASLVQNADARLVNDLNGPALLATAARLRDEARFTSGAAIKTPPAFFLGALISLELELISLELENEDRPPIEELSAAQYLVTTPLHDFQRLVYLLASFQATYADYLKRRPLLVSLPLISGVQSAQADQQDSSYEVCMRTMVAMIETLSMFDGVRGCNIVVEHFADLGLLEHVARAIKAYLE
jgi:hypothetical protein